MCEEVTLNMIKNAAARIKGQIHRTPVMTCSTLNSISKKDLYFKCENLQKTGSFKVRGALNTLKTILEEGKKPELIVTHSSGNHGQAVAWASNSLNLGCTVVVPEGTPRVKCQAIQGYNAELVFCTPTPTGRKETAERISKERNGVLVHPYDNYNVIAGQATIGLELLEEVPDLDYIIVPISGGGMTSGIALAAHYINPQCQVIAVEPEGKNLQTCLDAKERLWKNPPEFLNTIAEGIKTQQLGQLTFPILCDLIKQVVTVTDKEMADGCKVIAERMKLVVEAASGAAIAAAFSQECDFMNGKKVGIILCGGNLDMDALPWQIV